MQRAPAGAGGLGCESQALSFAVAQTRWSLAPRLWQCMPLLLGPEQWKSLRVLLEPLVLEQIMCMQAPPESVVLSGTWHARWQCADVWCSVRGSWVPDAGTAGRHGAAGGTHGGHLGFAAPGQLEA